MKKLSAVLLSAMMLLGLAACGDTPSSGAASQPGSGSASVSTPSTPDSGSESTPAATGGRTLEDIKATGKLVMMTNATFPPFEYITGSGVAGVDAALAQLIADEIGVELEILDMHFDLLVASLQNGRGDLVAAGMSITDERKEQVDFSIPYVDTTLLIIVPAGSEITGPDDLVGLNIAVQENTTGHLYVSENVEGADVQAFKSAVDAGTTVINGKADVAVIDEMTAKSIVEKSDGKLVLLEEPLSSEQYAMAVAKGSDELLAVVNSVLEKQVADDNVNALIAEHMLLAAE